MSTVRESLQLIAAALERLVVLETRKAGGATKVFDLAELQRRELEGKSNVKLVDPDEPA